MGSNLILTNVFCVYSLLLGPKIHELTLAHSASQHNICYSWQQLSTNLEVVAAPGMHVTYLQIATFYTWIRFFMR